MTNRSTILIADDDHRLLTAIKIRLEPIGFSVVTTDNGLRALELSHELVPEVLVLDVDMPGYDGFSLIEAMDCIPKLSTIPVIYITGAVSDAELTSRGDRLGAIALLRKPFEIDELISNIHLVLPPPACAA